MTTDKDVSMNISRAFLYSLFVVSDLSVQFFFIKYFCVT